jgi:hypothetical protein
VTPKITGTFSKLINRHVKVVAERGGGGLSLKAIECEVQTLEVRGHIRKIVKLNHSIERKCTHEKTYSINVDLDHGTDVVCVFVCGQWEFDE